MQVLTGMVQTAFDVALNLVRETVLSGVDLAKAFEPVCLPAA